MIPTPTHLVKCTEPLGKKEEKLYFNVKSFPEDSEYQFSGKVKCSCGNYVFEILYPGEVNEYGPCVAEIDGEYFYIIKARCISCGEEHLLFDDDFHGWNGWICHDQAKAALPRPELTEWKCSNCSDQKHRIVIIIHSQGKQDFIEEAGDEFDVTRWQDAFDWFTLDIKCENCGKETKDFISHETM